MNGREAKINAGQAAVRATAKVSPEKTMQLVGEASGPGKRPNAAAAMKTPAM